MTQDEISKAIWDLTLSICQANHEWAGEAFRGTLPTPASIRNEADKFKSAVWEARDLPNFTLVVDVVRPILHGVTTLRNGASRTAIAKALGEIALCINIVNVYANGVCVNYRAD